MLRVRAGRADRVDAEREGGGEPRGREPPAAVDACFGVRLKLAGDPLDRAGERLGLAGGVADRGVDADLVDGGAGGRGELLVEHRSLLDRLFLLGADGLIAPFLVEHGGAVSLPAPPLSGLLLAAIADRDVTATVIGRGQASSICSHQRLVYCGGVPRWMTSSSVPSPWRR